MPDQIGWLCIWEKCISFRCRRCHEGRQTEVINRDRLVSFPVYETPELLQGFRFACARCFGGPEVGTGSLRIELNNYDAIYDPLLRKMIPVFERIWRNKYA